MSLKAIVTPASGPNLAHMRDTADLQLGSTLFGKLPLEIRDMIYAECWKVSGLKQHVFMRDGRLTHSPCTLASDEVDKRLEDLQEMLETQQSPRGSRTRTLTLDDKSAARFSSPWHEHWPCEEREIVTNSGGKHHVRPRRTLFLPILLVCRRAYLEARPGLYASITLTFTDLAAAHACLALSPSTTASQLCSLAFSLVLPFGTLHQHRLRPDPTGPAGPWADLCTTLSNLVRFAALRDVTIRLDVAATTSPGDNHQVDENGNMDNGCDAMDVRAWWQVRERWVLSAVRGMLARRLVVQLPRTEPTHRRPEWSRPYNYPEESEKGGEKNEDIPFRKLERYAALPPIWFRKDQRVEIRVDSPRSPPSSPSFSITSFTMSCRRPRNTDHTSGPVTVGDRGKDEDGQRETGLQKVGRSLRELIVGL